MKDMMEMISNALKENNTIAAECEDRIALYIYPENWDAAKPFITIRPLQPPKASNYASDKNLSYEFYYQIDVQSYDRMKCKGIQAAIKEVMEGLKFSQQPGGLDDYFEETRRYVDARRYLTRTTVYDTDY